MGSLHSEEMSLSRVGAQGAPRQRVTDEGDHPETNGTVGIGRCVSL